MSADDSFADLHDRLSEGDPDAAAEVFDRYARRLVALARTRLERKLDNRVDPDDVLQSVLRSFFVRQAKGEFELQNWDSLWALLVRITIRKCGETARKHHAARRDVAREQRAPAEGQDANLSRWEAPSREPTADEVASLHETVESILGALSDTQREMLALHLQGFDPNEISAQTNRSETSVYRMLRNVRQMLNEQLSS